MRPFIAFVMLVSALVAIPAAAAPIGNDAFKRTWERTDKPVAEHTASRTWMWGPGALSDTKSEDYQESPGGQRIVQYFDKTRMEITTPGADPNSIWYVTNGLLVVEMVTGQMQTGNNRFSPRPPSQVNVAGDSDDVFGPTYASLAGVRAEQPNQDGALIIQRIGRLGAITTDQTMSKYNVTAAYRVNVPGINHQIASPFWSFMNESGPVWQNGQLVTDRLFPDPFYATGYPIIEPYWSTVKVAGTLKDVLIQCFERRCLTYTPGNPAGFQTEAGNVGQHYYTWRDGALPPQPNCDPAYPDFCVPPPPPDLNCDDPPFAGKHNFTVLPPDPHGVDSDNDGIGCETGSAQIEFLGVATVMAAPYGNTTTYVIGEVENLGDTAAMNIEVVASLYSANGTLVGSAEAYTIQPIIPSGGKSPWRIVASGVPYTSGMTARLQGTYYTYDPENFIARYYTVNFTISQLRWTDGYIVGQVRNDDAKSVQFVEVLVAGYSASGKLVAVENMYADLDVLQPGGTSPFSNSYPNYEGVPKSYQAYASASRIDWATSAGRVARNDQHGGDRFNGEAGDYATP